MCNRQAQLNPTLGLIPANIVPTFAASPKFPRPNTNTQKPAIMPHKHKRKAENDAEK